MYWIRTNLQSILAWNAKHSNTYVSSYISIFIYPFIHGSLELERIVLNGTCFTTLVLIVSFRSIQSCSTVFILFYLLRLYSTSAEGL